MNRKRSKSKQFRKESREARRQARLDAGLTEAQAARAAGLRLSSFLQYERTGTFPPPRAELLAHVYGCRLEVFL